jgi:hypothetical protein
MEDPGHGWGLFWFNSSATAHRYDLIRLGKILRTWLQKRGSGIDATGASTVLRPSQHPQMIYQPRFDERMSNDMPRSSWIKIKGCHVGGFLRTSQMFGATPVIRQGTCYRY